MTVELKTTETVTLTATITISHHDIELLTEIKDNMGFVYAWKVIRRIYPDMSLRTAKEIIEKL